MTTTITANFLHRSRSKNDDEEEEKNRFPIEFGCSYCSLSTETNREKDIFIDDPVKNEEKDQHERMIALEREKMRMIIWRLVQDDRHFTSLDGKVIGRNSSWFISNGIFALRQSGEDTTVDDDDDDHDDHRVQQTKKIRINLHFTNAERNNIP